MALMVTQIPIWEQIDHAESYLVCCMFDEAASSASSILKRLLANSSHTRRGGDVSDSYYDENKWDNMVESAGMVFVQSLNQLQRTTEILKELKLLFGSVSAIPVQVFLTGVCLQMMQSNSNVQGFLEEYLNNWSYEDDQYFSLSDADATIPDTEGSYFRVSICVDKYLEVVELYVITHLAMTLKEIDLAISWVNKAMLPMEKRQKLLRRLNSMSPSMATSSSQTSQSPLPDGYTTKSDFSQERRKQKDFESGYIASRGNTTKVEILKLSQQRDPCFWWFPKISFKFGDTRLVVPSGKILLAFLLLLIYYFTRKRDAAVKRVIAEKAVSIRKALSDLWKLAFSYQVNPLAAIQPL